MKTKRYKVSFIVEGPEDELSKDITDMRDAYERHDIGKEDFKVTDFTATEIE